MSRAFEEGLINNVICQKKMTITSCLKKSNFIVGIIVLSLFIYITPAFAVSSDVQSKLNNAIVIYIGSPKAYVNNEKTMIDFDNANIVPIIKNGVTLLPAKFISEKLGATVNFKKENSTIDVLLDNKNMKFTLGSSKALLNNNEIILDSPAESINGRLYLPLRMLVQDGFNKKIFFYKGVIIISDIENIVNLKLEKSSLDDIVQWFKDSELLRICTKNGWGYINRKTGKIAIKPKFYDAQAFHEGYALVMEKSGKVEKWGYINTNGDFVIKPIFIEASDFSEDLANVSIEGKNGIQYGFIDKKGKFVIEPKFQVAAPFIEGLAAVEVGEGLNNKWGYIDKTGNFAIEPKYDFTYMFKDGLAEVEVERMRKIGYINKKGEYVIQPELDGIGSSLSEGLINFRAGDWDTGKEGYMDTKGNIVIQPQFDYAGSFSEGLAVVTIGKDENAEDGYIDKTGKMIIPATKGSKGSFAEGLAIACTGAWEDSKKGFIDRTGNIVISQEFDKVEYFSEGLALVKKGDKWNYIDRKGNFVFNY